MHTPALDIYTYVWGWVDGWVGVYTLWKSCGILLKGASDYNENVSFGIAIHTSANSNAALRNTPANS